MPKVGDRVIIEGTKVGAQRREGSLVSMIGSLMRIRWTDGTESMLSPGAGSIRFESRTSGGATPKAAPKATKAAPKATKAGTTRKASKPASKSKASSAKKPAKKR